MDSVKQTVQELWWIFVLQGIVTFLLGLVALFYPGLSLLTLIVALAFYGILIGIGDLIFGFTTIKYNRTWWLTVIAGIVLIGVSAFLIRNPGIALQTFAILLGTIFIVRGVFEIAGAVSTGRASDQFLYITGGVLSVIAGIIFWVYSVSASLSFVWVLGVYAVIRGAIDIAGAVSARHEVNEFVPKRK